MATRSSSDVVFVISDKISSPYFEKSVGSYIPFSSDTKLLLNNLLSNFRLVLGFPPNDQLSDPRGYTDEEIWQFSCNLLSQRFQYMLHSLESFLDLQDRISNLAISHSMVRDVETSVHLFSSQLESTISPDTISTALETSSTSVSLVDFVYFNPTLLESLHLPTAHVIGVYLPLVLPLISSLAAGLSFFVESSSFYHQSLFVQKIRKHSSKLRALLFLSFFLYLWYFKRNLVATLFGFEDWKFEEPL